MVSPEINLSTKKTWHIFYTRKPRRNCGEEVIITTNGARRVDQIMVATPAVFWCEPADAAFVVRVLLTAVPNENGRRPQLA